MKDDTLTKAEEITILLALLDHNFDEVDGVRKLDQQLVYVPLTAIAGAAYVAIANHVSLPVGLMSNVPCALLVVWLVVAAGLARNTFRHLELLDRRRKYLAALPAHDEHLKINWLFWTGRVVYLVLFTLGVAAMWLLVST